MTWQQWLEYLAEESSSKSNELLALDDAIRGKDQTSQALENWERAEDRYRRARDEFGSSGMSLDDQAPPESTFGLE